MSAFCPPTGSSPVITFSGPGMPPWTVPPVPSKPRAELKMMNSLTKTKVPFTTLSGKNDVKWYMCGPTVYDASHMGHARTYLGFDIIRRILEGWFRYDVSLVMNITDIDDKIIKRSNERGIGFTELARHWEVEYLKDMEGLGVKPPDVMTRVSEFMPEITEYISNIIAKGFAYEANGSVYFDVNKFHGDEKHCYCKLLPTGMGNAELLAEGEGVLSGASDFVDEKKAPNDFALWKKSKEGEPSWDSPFGKGRPGWHIECSVMASDVFKKMGVEDGKMDIHSGGVDLKFPHHDNEMAQAEAEAGCSQWVNYFVHAGHLHIKGFKMSKSLKNFITIQQALEQNSARQIRMCFLLHKYNDPMDYGDETMSHAVERETAFNKFFQNVKTVLRAATKDDIAKWAGEEAKLGKAIDDCKAAVHDALCDDFDTPTVMSSLQNLVNATNLYLQAKEKEGVKPVVLVVRSAGVYVTRVFKVFGLVPEGGDIGFPVGGGEGGESKEDLLAPFLDAVLDFRSAIRSAARDKDFSSLLKLCDGLRDDVLPGLGVQLEDKEGSKGVWKLANPEDIKRQKEQKEQEAARKAEEKAAREREAAEKEKANLIAPLDFLKTLTLDDGKTLKYGNFGEDGMPTHNNEGEELNKNQTKKAKKEFEGQKKKYEKAMAKQSK
ncbi:hypothetical protein TL16_g12774 [Triparma laevis f. inornata]|uniref:cysteine--tRNA ligase n=2 Tax=Triparma laevis TaxID=1534972 RepID=A0A9W7FS16_9STRA|nr:hypothetical protein TL16_g12774 [Triparma laevis f. inornata]GMI17964.1 hypothetical protein TrLO_g8028 [Triparma laevis f. longispina]